ncbi:Holliday junction resolvase-like protein [Ferruginibacter sp.]
MDEGYYYMEKLYVYLIVVASVIVLIYLWITIENLKKKVNQKEKDSIMSDGLLREKDLMIQNIKTEIDGKAQDIAAIHFDRWKKEELEKYQKVIEDAGVETAQALLQRWKIDNEERIRKDAANRSVRNVLGKVTEHLIPFSEAMRQFNPKDVRFIGSPIDLIVFDGAEELKKDEVVIYFIEVKTGTSTLSKRQQLIKDAIQNRRIKWMRINMKDFGDDVNAALTQ